MSAPIDVTNDQLRQLLSLLQKFIPDIVVWAYGSRVKWTARQNSDLDLIVFSTPGGQERVAELRDAFAESDLPFLIDVHIWDEVPKVFHEIIRQQYVVLQDTAGVIGKRNSSAPVPDGWDMLPLLDCTSDRQISYGIVQPGSDESDGVPIVRVNNLTSSGIETRGAMRVAGQIERSYMRTRLKGGELLLSLVGTTGNVAIVPPELKGWNVARAIAVIRPREDIGPEWLKVCLESSHAREYLDARANTTVQKTLNLGDVKKLPIPLPPPAWRREILSLVSPLDDAIAGLRNNSETLESLARAIFKSWFVDFDPVRAKAEGREPEGMDAATAALFPNTFSTSVSGQIPVGWRVGPLAEVADVVYGAAFASKAFNAEGLGFPLIRIRDLKTMKPGVFTTEIHPKGFLVSPGDVVVGMDGEFRAYHWQGTPAWLNQRVCVFRPNCGAGRVFIREILRPLLAEVERGQVGTTVIHIGKMDIDRFRAVIPPNPVLKAFSDSAEPLLERLICNSQLIATLAELRDTLLPRLISGKLRIPEAEKLVEAVL